jgi:hypothetical protein
VVDLALRRRDISWQYARARQAGYASNRETLAGAQQSRPAGGRTPWRSGTAAVR